MPSGVGVHHRVVETVCKEVDAVDGIGVEIRKVVAGDKAADGGIVVSRIQEIQPRFAIKVVSSVTERIVLGYYLVFQCGVAADGGNGEIAPCIVDVRAYLFACSIVNDKPPAQG